MALYRERGFEKTTVEDIAARAGLTERTFFRYFADKREVLFWGAKPLQDLLVDGVASAPAKATPIDAVAQSLVAVAAGFEERRDFSRQRQALITAHAELMERELAKLASLGAAIAATLRRRGVPEPAATLAAETGITVFKLAFEHWLRDAKRRAFAHHIRALFEEIRAVTAGKATRPARPRPAPRATRRRRT